MCDWISWLWILGAKQDELSSADGMSYRNIATNLASPSTGIVSLWLALFIYDMVTFILTAARTYKFWRKDNVQPLRMSLFPLLFRDGAIYFAVMAQANLANILTFYLCGPFMRGGLSTFASCDNAMPPHAQLAFDR
ncbi:hypothetical protein MPER_02871 [Moniliophthora perniciosa FA553]|nr:hypothetical protein MPER_02871 [Moniliophthora perniciosa FA553]